MTDVFDPATRSRIMAGVRQRDTKPEMVVRRIVHGMGYRYRLHVSTLPGRPDIVFPRLGKVIQVNGCLWHGHPGCQRAKLPQANAEFWRAKIETNARRDQATSAHLTELGWEVLAVWECETKDTTSLKRLLQDFLGSDSPAPSQQSSDRR